MFLAWMSIAKEWPPAFRNRPCAFWIASHFETFLRHYRQLFSALPSFQLIYVATRPAPFRWAEAVFNKHMSKRTGPIPTDPLVNRLNHYFEFRSQYEAKDFGG